MAHAFEENSLSGEGDPRIVKGREVLLARQSIMDSSNRVVGFEMLYRGSELSSSDPKSGLKATSELLTNICTCVIEEKFNVNHPIFINVDERFIESPYFFPSPTDKITLELLKGIPATPSILSKIKQLKRQGFEFALDDYTFELCQHEFLPLVSVVKIDLLACSFDEIEKNLNTLQSYSVKLLAEKVESFGVFNRCVALGFDLFQGTYLERPKAIQGTKVPVNKQVTLNLLSELTRPDIAINKVAELISCDPRLAMKIILLVNSSLFSFVREVSDVQEAVVMLGIDAVKRWAMILLLVSESEQPIEIFRTLLCRAKTLELYAEEMNENNPSDYFSLGLFSAIDAVLGVEMSSIVESLPLKRELKLALTKNSGNMGQVLLLLKQLEKGDKTAPLLSLDNAYWQGLTWADELMGSMSD
jgi:EAL and modified HD-GYP domain-containing signal transduction protein